MHLKSKRSLVDHLTFLMKLDLQLNHLMIIPFPKPRTVLSWFDWTLMAVKFFSIWFSIKAQSSATFHFWFHSYNQMPKKRKKYLNAASSIELIPFWFPKRRSGSLSLAHKSRRRQRGGKIPPTHLVSRSHYAFTLRCKQISQYNNRITYDADIKKEADFWFDESIGSKFWGNF